MIDLPDLWEGMAQEKKGGSFYMFSELECCLEFLFHFVKNVPDSSGYFRRKKRDTVRLKHCIKTNAYSPRLYFGIYQSL